MLGFDAIRDCVCEVVQGYPVRRVELFGSYAENRQTDESDVDLLVEFTSAAVSLLTLSSLRNRLESVLGVSVDLVHAPLPADSFLEIGEKVMLYER